MQTNLQQQDIAPLFEAREFSSLASGSLTLKPSDILPINAARIGWALLALGQVGEAREFIDSAVSRNRHFGNAMLGDETDSILASAAIEIPEWAWPHIVSAGTLLKAGKIEAALEAMTLASTAREHSSEQAHGFTFTNVCLTAWNRLRAEAYPAIKRLVEADLLTFGERGWNLAQKALLDQCDGDWANARRHFAAIGEIDASVSHALLGANTFNLSLGHQDRQDGTYAPFQPLDHDIVATADWAFLAGADGKYFDQFAEKYVSSIARHAAGSTIHFCIASPLESTDALVEQLRQKYAAISINISRYASARLSPNKQKTSFACLRFLAGPSVADLYAKGMLITDVDAALTGSLDAQLAKLLENDVAITYLNVPYRLPWQSAVADRVWIATSPNGRDWLRKVAEYCSTGLMADRPDSWSPWWLDQNATRFALDEVIYSDGVKFLNLWGFDMPLEFAGNAAHKKAEFAGRNVQR